MSDDEDGENFIYSFEDEEVEEEEEILDEEPCDIDGLVIPDNPLADPDAVDWSLDSPF